MCLRHELLNVILPFGRNQGRERCYNPLSYAVASRLLQRSSCLELIQNRKGVERGPKTKDRQGSGARDATIIGLLAPKFSSQSELDDCGLSRFPPSLTRSLRSLRSLLRSVRSVSSLAPLTLSLRSLRSLARSAPSLAPFAP